MYLDYDHLHLYVKNYNKYQRMIALLDLEIEELETMINPKGIRYDTEIKSGTPDERFKIQCFHEINERQDRQDAIQKMITIVDELQNYVGSQGVSHLLEYHILTQRVKGNTLEQIAESLNYSINAINNRYCNTLNEFLVNYHALRVV